MHVLDKIPMFPMVDFRCYFLYLEKPYWYSSTKQLRFLTKMSGHVLDKYIYQCYLFIYGNISNLCCMSNVQFLAREQSYQKPYTANILAEEILRVIAVANGLVN